MCLAARLCSGTEKGTTQRRKSGREQSELPSGTSARSPNIWQHDFPYCKGKDAAVTRRSLPCFAELVKTGKFALIVYAM
jgi:hypothetical protein